MIAHVWRHPTHTRTHNVRSIFVCVTLALKWEGNLSNKIGWLWYVIMKSCVKDAWPHGPTAPWPMSTSGANKHCIQCWGPDEVPCPIFVHLATVAALNYMSLMSFFGVCTIFARFFPPMPYAPIAPYATIFLARKKTQWREGTQPSLNNGKSRPPPPYLRTVATWTRAMFFVFTKVCKTSHCTAHCLPISCWPIGRMKSYVSVCNSCNNADHILSFVFVLPLAAPHKFSVHRICSDSWWHLHRDAGAMHNYCISLGFVNLWTAEVWYKTNNIF